MATRMTGEQRREQLLDATKAIVVDDGFHAVSIEAVARRGGHHAPDRLRPLRRPRRAARGARGPRVAARACAAPGDLRRPARRADRVPGGRPRRPRHVAAGADAAGGRAAAAARADRGRPRGVVARLAQALPRVGPARPGAVARTCSRPTPTRPPGSRSRATTSSGSSSSRAGRCGDWPAELGRGHRPASSARDRRPSLRYALVRWSSIVFSLRNNAAAVSRLVAPLATVSAT